MSLKILIADDHALLRQGLRQLLGDENPDYEFVEADGFNAALEALAEEHAVTAAQLAIAWVASRGKDIIPLIGTKRRERLTEALEALDLTLSGDDLAAIEAAVPADAVAGGRYEASQMAALDSER